MEINYYEEPKTTIYPCLMISLMNEIILITGPNEKDDECLEGVYMCGHNYPAGHVSDMFLKSKLKRFHGTLTIKD